MSKYAVFILLLLTVGASADAATVKEIRSALSDKYQITKRKLTGGFKEPGTIVYVAIPDFSVEVPRTRVSSLTIIDGRIDPNSVDQKSDRISVPIGEPLYVLSHKVKDDLISLHLATESAYPARIFGVDQERDMQVKLDFRIGGGIESISVDDALSLISAVIATDVEAEEQPALAAMIEIRRNQLNKPIDERKLNNDFQAQTSESARQAELGPQESEDSAERKDAEVSAVREDSTSDKEPRQSTSQGSIAEREAAKRKELSRNHASVNFQVECSDLFIPEVFEEKFRGLIPVYSMVVLNNSSKRYTVEYDLVYERNKEAVKSREIFGTRIAGQRGYSETLTDTKRFSIRPGALSKYTIMEKSQSGGTQVDQIKAIDVFRCTSP